MRSNYRRSSDFKNIVEGFVRDVRDIDDHSESVHFVNHLLTEIGKAVVMLDLGIVQIARGIGPHAAWGPPRSRRTPLRDCLREPFPGPDDPRTPAYRWRCQILRRESAVGCRRVHQSPAPSHELASDPAWALHRLTRR